MNADIVQKMREEEADLARKLQAVRDFLRAYSEAPKSPENEGVKANPKGNAGPREKVEITSFTDQTRRSVVLAMQALTTSSTLMKTRELVDFVEAMGHEISGVNKVNALGALLARSVDLVGHGKAGWALADREKAIAIVNRYTVKEKEPDSANAAGPDAGTGSAPTQPVPWNRPQTTHG